MTARRAWIDRGSARPTIVADRGPPGGDSDDAMRDAKASSRSPATEISELS